MGNPVFLAENFFNGGFPGSMYPGQAVTAEEEASGFEVHHLANGRRSPTDYWTSTTANSDTWAETKGDRIRAANMIVLDRGHNLAGKSFKLEGSDDNFTTIDTVIDITIPSVTAPGSIDETLGIVTEEGAWIKRFPLRAHLYWRIFIPLMGAGLTPFIVGVWLGLSYEPDFLWRPSAEGMRQLAGREFVSPSQWRGRSVLVQPRTDTLTLKLKDVFVYDQARLHLEGLFGSGWPTWIVYDEDQADRAILALAPLGTVGFVLAAGTDWSNKQAQIRFIEHAPKKF